MRHLTVLLFAAILLPLVIALATGQQPGKNLNAIKLPVGRAVLVKVVGTKRGNAKNKKKKGVDKFVTPKPVAKRTTTEKSSLVKRECEFIGVVDKDLMRTRTMRYIQEKSTAEGGTSIKGYNGISWYRSQFSTGHSFEYAFRYCFSLAMRLPSARDLDEFKKMYDFMNGSTSDNFYDQTYLAPNGKEKWCYSNKTVPPEISIDGLKLLNESSILVTRKNSLTKYKLEAIPKSQLTNQLSVNYFYCEIRY